MRRFDVFEIGGGLFLVVQAGHLLGLNSVVVVPVLPRDAYPALRKLTVDVKIDRKPYRIRTHMPLTIDAGRLRHTEPVHRLSPYESQKVIDGLNTTFCGF